MLRIEAEGGVSEPVYLVKLQRFNKFNLQLVASCNQGPENVIGFIEERDGKLLLQGIQGSTFCRPEIL